MHGVLRFAVLWGIGAIAFTIVDIIWIGVVASPLYRSEVGDLLVLGDAMSVPRILAALITWLLITLSIVCFVLPPASQGFLVTLGRGILLGLIIYGVYDLTNYAVLRGWTLKITLLDIAWGMCICGFTSVLVHAVNRWLFSVAPGG